MSLVHEHQDFLVCQFLAVCFNGHIVHGLGLTFAKSFLLCPIR